MAKATGRFAFTALTAGLLAVNGWGAGSAYAADFEPTPPSDPISAAVWAGVGLKEDVVAGYTGGVLALNGDLGSTGFLLRASGLYVDYDFESGFAPGGVANGNFYRGDVSFGYQFVNDGLVFALFGGADFQNRDIDPAAADDGTLNDEIGFIVHGRFAADPEGPLALTLEGNYSTANDTFWTRAQTGFALGSFTVGPEVSYLGNDSYTEARFGAFSKFNLMSNTELQFRAGYAEQLTGEGSSNSGGDGAYGGATIVLLFWSFSSTQPCQVEGVSGQDFMQTPPIQCKCIQPEFS